MSVVEVEVVECGSTSALGDMIKGLGSMMYNMQLSNGIINY